MVTKEQQLKRRRSALSLFPLFVSLSLFTANLSRSLSCTITIHNLSLRLCSPFEDAPVQEEAEGGVLGEPGGLDSDVARLEGEQADVDEVVLRRQSHSDLIRGEKKID